MAARAATDRPPPSAAASYVPSQLSMQDALLCSRISLPPNPTICYALLKSASADAIELARRSILSRYATSPIQSSILTSVSIGHDPHIYFFKLEKSSSSVAEVFRHVGFDELTIQEMSSFSPPNASALFPDDDKRILIVRFFDALRSRLIQDIVDSASKKASLSQRQIKRFKSGFLMSQISSPSGWEYKATTRSLVFCHLQIHFSYRSDGIPSHLIIHPMLLSTPFLDISPSLPLPPGTPITLLPFGTPAFFLACYSGPTAGLTKQFHSALQGLGAGEWDNSPASLVRSTFIIGWIKVENKQGEDKGLTIIYPTKLCLLCLPLTSSRGSLDYIPDLPAPLQPSPQASRFHSSESESVPTSIHASQSSFISSPPPESFRSFCALTLSSNDLERATAEVGEYIDAVARERERERERLRRERELGTATSPKTVRIPPTTPLAVGTESIEQSMSSSSTISSAPLHDSLPPSSPGLSTPPPSSAAIQTFYPSPPQSDPTLVLPTEAKTAQPAKMIQMSTEEAPESEGAPFDGYDMDSTWSRTKDGYLDMDMNNMDFVMNDIGLDFNLDVGPMVDPSSTGATVTPFNDRANTTIATTGIELEGAFTDDDFSFFDQPSKPNPPPRQSPNPHAESSTLLSASLPGSAIGSRMSFPGLRNLSDLHTTQSTGQLYTPGDLKDDFTPRSPVDHINSAPGHLPTSSRPTPESYSVPSTPTVHLEPDESPKQPVAIGGGLLHIRAGLFEPIPFAAYHREADDKYAVGKFALPSPPPEAGLPDGASVSLPPSTSQFPLNGGWRFEYNAATDPRIGLVRRLIGVKRKLSPTRSKLDIPPSKKVFWTLDQEDWDGGRGLTHENEESDVDSIEYGPEAEESDNTTPARPTTPAPSYLPLGPTLLSSHFQHSHLLSLSVPLRPPGAAIRPHNLASTNNPTPSVPTPVSPAATMGAASERSRSLEAAASTVAVEVVENPLWAESWKANVTGVGRVGGVWSTDIKVVQKLLDCIPGSEAPLTVAELFGLVDMVSNSKVITAGSKSTLHPMEPPMISIGKGEAVIQVLPPALRFWDKLGLSPKGGRKNMAAFVMFEENVRLQPLMETWLGGFRNAYQAKHYGVVTLGHSTACTSNGLVPLRFDATFRKSFGAFISSLTAPTPTTVVFFVLPIAILSLSSPVLRQILSAAKVLANHHTGQILFEFIPEQHIYSGLSKTSAYDSTLDILSTSVYNRILVPVDHLRPRRVDTFDDRKDDTRFYSMAPSFTLARPIHNKASFSRAAHTSLDVMDRYTLLHVAYHLTPCGKWIIACCIDQRGENHDFGVWLTHSPGEHEGETEHSNEEYAVKKVWDFAMQFARKTNVEWRVVFAKLGGLSLSEMEAWTAYLSLNVLPSREQAPLHHSLICVIPDTPWLFLPSKPSLLDPIRSSPSSAKQPVFFTDVSSTTYAIFPNIRLPISHSPSQNHLVSAQSFIPEPLISHSNVTSSPHLQPMRPSNISGPQRAKSPSSLSRPLSETDRHEMPLLPHSSSILIQIPHPHDSTTASKDSMIHIHLLRTYHSASHLLPSSEIPDDKQLLEDVTRNYYELSVLSKTRWKLDGIGGHNGLPFHLAATDAMRMALDRFDGTVEP